MSRFDCFCASQGWSYLTALLKHCTTSLADTADINNNNIHISPVGSYTVSLFRSFPPELQSLALLIFSLRLSWVDSGSVSVGDEEAVSSSDACFRLWSLTVLAASRDTFEHGLFERLY